MGNLHLVFLAVVLILTVFQFVKTSGQVTTTTGISVSQAPTSASKATQATGANSASGPASKPPDSGSTMHGLSPLILVCGILAKLFLSA